MNTDMPTEPRYEYCEYERAGGMVSVIIDSQNPDAWIRSTVATAVEQ